MMNKEQIIKEKLNGFFKIIAESNDYKLTGIQTSFEFGNAFAEYSSRVLKFIFIWDKGKFSIDVESAIDKKVRCDLDILKALILNSNDFGSCTMECQDSFITENITEIEDLYKNQLKNLNLEIKRLKKLRAKKLFPSAFEKNDNE